MVMIDECHATGFIGWQEKARLRLSNGRVDIITGTLEKPWGAMGGYTTAKKYWIITPTF
jgi:7-keto-8-aminopelargonate synthetase-like enzyme